MVQCPVIRSLDINFLMGPPIHNYYGAATAYAAPSPGVAVEGSYHPMKFPPGMVSGDHKLAANVCSYSFSVVQGGHKLGPLVLHVEAIPAPDDLLTPVQMLKSSWEVKFQNGEVTAQGAPLGSLYPALMNAVVCTDLVSMPLGWSPSSLINSVFHDVSWTDIVAGWAEIIVQAVIEFIGFLAGGGFAGGGAPASISSALLPSPEGMAIGAAASTYSSLAGAAVRWVGREYYGYGGAITVQTGVSGGVFGGQTVAYTSNADGSWNVQETTNAPLGLASSSNQYGEDAQGNSTRQHTERLYSVTRQETVTEQRQPDGSRYETRQETVTEGVSGRRLFHDERTAPATTDWL